MRVCFLKGCISINYPNAADCAEWSFDQYGASHFPLSHAKLLLCSYFCWIYLLAVDAFVTSLFAKCLRVFSCFRRHPEHCWFSLTVHPCNWYLEHRVHICWSSHWKTIISWEECRAPIRSNNRSPWNSVIRNLIPGMSTYYPFTSRQRYVCASLASSGVLLVIS